MTEPFAFVPLSRSLPYWPSDIVGRPAFLDDIGVRDFEVDETNGLGVTGTLLWYRELAFDLPLLEGFSLAFLSEGGHTAVDFEVDVEPLPELRLPSLTAALRVRGDLLRPVRLQEGQWVPDLDAAGRRRPAEVRLEGVGLSIDAEGEIEAIMPSGAPALSLGAVEIGQTGVVLEVTGLRPYLSASQTPPAGAPAGFRGVALDSVQLHLPRDVDVPLLPSDLTLEDMLIGTGGFSGTVRGTWSPSFDAAMKRFTGNGSGNLFSIPFGMRSLEFSFAQNAPTAAGLTGDVMLPFFEQPVRVDLSLAARGGFAVALSSGQPAGATQSSGLVTFDKPGIVRCSLESLGFSYDEGVATVKLSGRIKPLVPGVEWPTFELRELSIDSEGNVRLQGGWLDLREAYTLNLYGFRLEITKLGFGQMEDGARWIGFSGGLKLVEGMPAGASVEGLRLVWYEDGRRAPYLTLNGVGVELAVPGAFSFRGAVSYRELVVGTELVRRFDGDIHLQLEALNLSVDAVLVVGSAEGPQGPYTFFAIYLAADLPAGIPLWATGLGLYGVAGLFALNMEPDKRPDEEWYDGWYKRPQIGVTDLRQKWINRRDSLAFGAGVTLGTVADNGFTFAGRFLLVIVLPGPIVMIEGKANLLKERAKLNDEPTFRGLAVIDGRAGSLLVGLDAQYKYDTSAALVDVRGGAEAFYDFNDPTAWHLYVGEREPREKRIRAEIFRLFEANAYLMLDARELALGAWVGYDRRWDFGPLAVTLEAWLEGNAKISFRPAHFYGDAWLHGNVALRVFGFGLGISLDARLAADVFDPLHIVGEFEVTIDLPWPFPDFGVDVRVEWGPEPDPPPLPAPLKEITVEHLKSSATWPLPRGSLLQPSHADADGMLVAPSPSVATQAAAAPPATAPVVPLDARPHITFSRAVHDVALIGMNVQPPSPDRERIGDPARNQGPATARFELIEVALDRWTGLAWQRVARKGADANPSGVRALYGSWAPVPNLPTGGGTAPAQTKLWLWSRNPFDYLRHTSGQWTEWVSRTWPFYPCVPPAPGRHVCWDVDLDNQNGKDRGTWIDSQTGEVMIGLPEPADSVTVTFPGGAEQPPKPGEQVCISFEHGEQKELDNPVRDRDAGILVLDHHRLPYPVATITDGRFGRGLDCGFALQIDVPCPATEVTLTFAAIGRAAYLKAFDADGNTVDGVRAVPAQGPVTVTVRGSAIDRVHVDMPSDETVLASLCWVCQGSGGGLVSAVDQKGGRVGPVAASGTVTLTGTGLVAVAIGDRPTPRGTITICVDLPPDPAEVEHRRVLAEHVRAQSVRWSEETPVLEPHTTYRLSVTTRVVAGDFAPDASWNGPRDQTEYGYFRTEGPPGLAALTPPAGHPATVPFQTGLEDLTRYVRQTMPPTVAPAGEPPRLPRPVYRAYDVGVEFNEDYVETMYAHGQRDLGLYLFDNNDRPVRDARGRVVVPANLWGRVEGLTLTESEAQWIEMVIRGTCATVDVSSVQRDATLGVGEPGLVLDGDTVYEARLVPLLLHDRFTAAAIGTSASGPSGTLQTWSIRDDGTTGAPSVWSVVAAPGAGDVRRVRQQSAIRGGSSSAGDPVKPGTVLRHGDPQWTDYRLTATLRTGSTGAIGLVFREQDDTRYYRFSMDPGLGYRRLVVVLPAGHTVLAEDDGPVHADNDYVVTIEAVGARLAVILDGEPLFEVEDTGVARGRIGLYTSNNAAAHFGDVRLDDLRAEARTAYRFQFTTSRFATFAHHLHSYDDLTRVAVAAAGSAPATALPGQVAAATAPTTAVTDAETRAYEALATGVLGQAARNDPPAVEVTRVGSGGTAYGLLVRGPEPIDPRRTAVALERATRPAGPVSPPRKVKITGAAFAAGAPNGESVSLLLRDAADLSAWRIEQLGFADPLPGLQGDPVMFEQAWMAQPTGAQVLVGDASWRDVRVSARLQARGDTPVGVLFRHADAQNHLRLVVDRTLNRTRLLRTVAGTQALLWEQSGSVPRHTPFTLVVEAVGSRLRGYLDDTPLFDLTEPTAAVAAGQAGVVRDNAGAARFERLEVARPGPEAGALWLDAFGDGTTEGWIVVDEGTTGGPSAWAVTSGELRQTSAIRTVGGNAVANLGTLALAGDLAWTDVIVRARLSSQGSGGVGVAFRVADQTNLYRFSMDQTGGRRLVKRVGGTFTTLWEDGHIYESGRAYDVVVAAVGDRLRGWVDGVAAFSVRDASLAGGRIGLYTHDTPQARFAQVQVHPAAAGDASWLVDEQLTDPALPAWTFLDEGDTGGPSVWGIEADELRQASSIVASAAGPAARGTLAVTGELDWTDLRLSARLRTSGAGAIGLVFRYRDGDNHYRFVNDTAGGQRRLVRVTSGTATVLWSDAAPFPVGASGLITVECVGDVVAGYVNGIEAFRLSDPAGPAAGRVGLLCAGDPEARFADVRVSAAEWCTWHRFADEPPLPAGTAVVVHAGSVADAATAAPLVERRFRAMRWERGAPALRPDGTQLRLVAADGSAEHARPVLPDRAFTAVTPRVLRKHDGTGMFVVPSSGALTPGTYRLKLTFRRDNRVADPASQVLRQAGQATAEEATIEIPAL